MPLEPIPPGGLDRPVGAVLQRERVERGITIAEVSEATRIDPGYLEALEDDAPEDAFPGRAYARFFLREYARHLGVSDEPLVDALDARWLTTPDEAESLGSVLPLIRVPAPRRGVLGHLVFTVGGAGLLLGLVAIIAVSGRSSQSREPLASGAAHASSTHAPPSPARTSPQPPSPVTSMVARIIATDGRCWVRAVRGDGTELFQTTLEVGQRTTVRARKSIHLDLGAAEYVRLVVNGRTISTGKGVVHLTLSLGQGRVVVS